MRIRKRQLPFPLSSFSPLPLSDPNLINHPPTPLLLPQSPSALTASASPDRPLPPIAKPIHASAIVTHTAAPRPHNQHPSLSDEDGTSTEPDGGGEKRNDTRKGGILGCDTAAEVVPPSNQDGRWWEGEKAIPLKKRSGSFDRRGSSEHKKMKTRMKTKMNKKCSSAQNDNAENGEEEEERKGEVHKKRGRGGAVMEGSRCSRVNGRGWRCCQQTLVGYSLCEHHLGKGRLRSITSVRTSSIPTTATSKNKPDPLRNWEASSSSPEEQRKIGDSLGIDIGIDKDEKKPLLTTKKRMKLGMVKARSISSLLGQTNTQISVAYTQNNE